MTIGDTRFISQEKKELKVKKIKHKMLSRSPHLIMGNEAQIVHKNRKLCNSIIIQESSERIGTGTYDVSVEHMGYIVKILECQSEKDVKDFLNILKRLK